MCVDYLVSLSGGIPIPRMDYRDGINHPKIFSVFFSYWWPGEAISPGNTDGAELDIVAGWPGRPLKPEIQFF